MFLLQRLKDALEIPSCSRVEPERKRRKVRPELPSVSTPHVSTEEVDPGAERTQETEAMEVRETEEDMPGTFEGTKECASCCVLQSEKRQLRNTVNTLRGKLKAKREDLTKIKKKLEGRSCSWADYSNVFVCIQ